MIRLCLVAMVVLACGVDGPLARKQAAAKFATMFAVAPYMCNDAHDWCTGLRNGETVMFVCGGGACRFTK